MAVTQDFSPLVVLALFFSRACYQIPDSDLDKKNILSPLQEINRGYMEKDMLEVGIRFSKAERKRLRKRKQIKPSIWSELHRVLIKSRPPGVWKYDVTPHLVGIMDAAALPFIRRNMVI